MDIEAIAKQAGMVTEGYSAAASCVWTNGVARVSAEQLKLFTELVAAAEREACAKVCEQIGDGDPGWTKAVGEVCADTIRKRPNVADKRPVPGSA